MAKRISTTHTGVYYAEVFKLGSKTQTEKVYYIRYRLGGRGSKLIEEPVGRESEGMTPAKASYIRADRARKRELPNAEQRKSQAAAKLAEQSRPTFEKLWELYQKHKPNRRFPQADNTNYNRYLKEDLGRKTPLEIVTLDLDRIRLAATKSGLAAQSVKHIIGLAKRLARFGADKGLYDMPPASKLKFVMPKVDNEKTETMTAGQLSAYLEALDAEADQHLASFLRLALFTGMRKSALLGLQWVDVDFERGFITLRGDTAKKGRTEVIPMSDEARAVLRGIPKGESPYLFPGLYGGMRENFRRMARRVRDKAGLPPDFRPLHGLRHTFASLLASSGEVDLYTLQRLLTHESPDMTTRYAHLSNEALRRAASVAAGIFKKARKPKGIGKTAACK